MATATNFHLFSFGLLVINILFQGSKAVCPDKWKEYDTKCYGVQDHPSTWAMAESECQEIGHGGHLASLGSETQMEIIANYMKTNHKKLGDVWVGLHDERETGLWAWTDDRPFNYKPWSPGKNGSEEYCAMLSRKSGYTKFHTSRCRLRKAYLCELLLA